MTSKVIFENQHYVVCVTKAGLSVQNKKKGTGKLLLRGTQAFLEWLLAFENADNSSESNELARAIYIAE